MAKEEARSSWSGSVSFGMVQFPVRLFGATRSKTYRFNNVHAACGSRTNAPTVCRPCGTEIDASEIHKGVQIDKETFVRLTPEDLESLPLVSTKTVEVIECVKPEDVPAVMQERTYYVGPDPRPKVSDKAFVLFREALEKTGLVAIGKLARSGRESLCAIRPQGQALALQLLYWSDEIVSSAAVELGVDDVEITDEERSLATQLLKSLVKGKTADLTVYEDSYRLAVQELVEALAAGRKVTALPQPKKQAGDLMATLKASVKAAKAA